MFHPSKDTCRNNMLREKLGEEPYLQAVEEKEDRNGARKGRVSALFLLVQSLEIRLFCFSSFWKRIARLCSLVSDKLTGSPQ